MKRTLSYILIFLAGAIAAFFYVHHEGENHKYAEMHESHHGNKLEKEHHGNLSHKHDEVNMPGLQGKDTTKREVSDLKEIFQSHKGISRVVTNLTDGIVTTTEAEDETLREAIVSHVSMMITRIEEGKNPEVMIQSPTLDKLFGVYNEIDTEIELTNTGVKVTQTSANPEVVKLLQTHAAEVSDMSKRGMQAVHERMAKQGH
ncbi:hypothetical protein N9L23_02680 [Alphaproteobacteria bacterium]|nr:hypothetical protein [Alphaproteobacteria bacterium]